MGAISSLTVAVILYSHVILNKSMHAGKNKPKGFPCLWESVLGCVLVSIEFRYTIISLENRTDGIFYASGRILRSNR